MANTKRSTPAPEGQGTLTERARRAQLVEVTIELVADRGYAGASLARIAERAGITKAAVLYHFSSKAAVVEAAYEHVLTALTGSIASAVEAAPVADGPAAYIRSMVGYLNENPRHTRMIVESMIEEGTAAEPPQRWQALAQILDAARDATVGRPLEDSRTLAIIIGGAVDAIVGEQLNDPAYDTVTAAEQLVSLVNARLREP
ncbi:TetR/AcrR family transcriptional regulator [Spiractinospora alimapuensis]|uniref:TetR/AcrR family transcriptional regulator n=1 Tax=Spiractinospora alimapuensis TaxID=2820884 RepID=UPI001F2D1B81|nr:TetR/AcrR family transcriptional regulator [Spiractinospora alimapuensis]QVQ51549.1 TetR/AcrR family transcriptional regulator [Spiractinospora alimapuensis]